MVLKKHRQREAALKAREVAEKNRVAEERKTKAQANSTFFAETDSEPIAKRKERDPDFPDPDLVVKVR